MRAVMYAAWALVTTAYASCFIFYDDACLYRSLRRKMMSRIYWIMGAVMVHYDCALLYVPTQI